MIITDDLKKQLIAQITQIVNDDMPSEVKDFTLTTNEYREEEESVKLSWTLIKEDEE